ncbi:hypothetical protein SAV14893_030190 [Streptomyces avermitilis]|uniref:5-formyltetrahydrofolate cyclo-ligase n=1 Tax=Streptomyces avermitilis TaxID=33903 RepID=A0A4D4LW72_STRAX|nr:hypothetical protein SAV14893_030190 [Streptomyces avermitilis]
MAGRKRVPRPAAGMTALVILGCDSVMPATISGGYVRNLWVRLIHSHMSALERIREKPVSHLRPGSDPDKRMLRREFLVVRSRLTADDVRETASALAARALELPELAHARTVAAYVSVGSEPGTLALLDALHARGVRVLLPVLLADNDLDWGAYAGQGSLARVRHGGKMALLEPAGTRLGPSAVLGADAVLLPGLAVDSRGCAWAAAGARTTGYWPAWSARAWIRPWWCCCTTRRSWTAYRRSRTTGRCTRR